MLIFVPMKKIFTLLLVISLGFFSCESVEKNTFVLKGQTDLPEGKRIFRISPNANNQPVYIDTTTVTNGNFELIGDVDQIDVNFLFIEGEQQNVPFIVEEGIIEIALFKDSIASSKIKGTTSNNDLNDYRSSTADFTKKINAVATEIQSANSMGDNLYVTQLQADYTAIQERLNAYEMEFLRTQTDSYISSLIMERFLSQKLIQVPEAKIVYNTYTDRIKSSRSGINVANIINKPVNPTAIGQIAPLFEGPTPAGDLVSLESLRGKVTIIDFWASWCRPCRIENPNLVRLYNRMHDKGLEIIGVSLDRNKASWERAIADDGLKWNHVSNLQYWSDPIAKLYGVRAIPAAFVLDSKGKIVAKNLRGAQLDAKIEELLQD